MKYVPSPIDVSSVAVPEELMRLAEKLAENTHDLWSQQRIKEGWKFGEQRNDLEKTHPNLVPYEELKEDEKQYDRVTSLGTIKAMLALGFQFTREEKVEH